jgi:hypothetical protein
MAAAGVTRWWSDLESNAHLPEFQEVIRREIFPRAAKPD